MILEDFFTLTEMKDGLTTLARVDELISIMREQKVGATNNLGDALRQWSTVASVLAATENENCANHFVHLDGLLFLSEWLQEARKQSSDTIDGSAETFVSLLLGLLLRLPINKENSHISRIEIAVRQFLNHKNQNIVDRASKFLNNLVVEGDDSVRSEVPMKCDPCFDEGMKGDSRTIEMKPSQLDHDASSSKYVNYEVSSGPESAIKGVLHQDNKTCKIYEVENFFKEKRSISNEHTPSSISSSGEAAGCAISGNLNSLQSSSALDLCEENASAVHDSSVCLTTGITSSSTRMAPSLCGVNAHEDHEISKETVSDSVKEMEKEPLSCVSSRNEALVVPASSGLSSSSPCARECISKLVQLQNLDSKDCDAKESVKVQNTSSTECELSTTENCHALKNSDTIEYGLPRHFSKTEELKSVVHDLSGPFSQDSINRCNGKDASANTNGVEVSEKSHLKVRRRARLKKKSCLFKEKLTSSTASGYGNRGSEMGIEYGDDALEFAVQVAIEAKLEVADREQCSSSHEGSSEDNTTESDSQYSHEEKHDQLNLDNSVAKAGSSNDSSNKSSSKRLKSFDNNDKDQVQELESTEVTSIIQEPVRLVEKTRYNFDLNADFSNDDVGYLPTPVANYQNNLSMPIAVVAAPNGAPFLAIGARSFEGEQGWKGSAPTSAFSPASPRRISDGEKMAPTNNKFNLFKIDLNISEGDNNIPVDQAVEKQTPDLSEFPSGDYSVEVISRKSGRLNLDLNRLGDDETFSNTSSHSRHQHQNDNCSSSPACSSSARQAAMKDFDLNDNPLFFDASSHNNQLKSSFKHENPYDMHKPDDSVITILGSRMTVAAKKSEPFFQTHQPFLANGLSMESTVARPSLGYSHMPTTGYGHNELTLRPSTFSPIPAFHSPGTFPYMVDSRGSTSRPDFGSSTGMHDPSAYGSSFLVNFPGAPPGFNSIGRFQPGFDLNSGALFMENGSKEMGSFRQLSVQGQGSIREEQIRTVSQSASGSNLPIKRKEPECEPSSYPFGYKQVTSWH